MTDLLVLINDNIKKYLNTIENQEYRELLEYSLFPGGKRFRPLLTLSILVDLGIEPILGVNQAIAIELIHNYSLIHDDLPAMDDDLYRRNKLTVHKQFSEANAILAGDALLSDAFSLLVKGNVPDKSKLKIIELVSSSIGSFGMVYGQFLDVNSTLELSSVEDIKAIHLLKTGKLINAAIVIGAIIGNVDREKLVKFEELSYLFSLAFQIKDDLEDFNKNSSDDINKKVTYPNVLGYQATKELFDNLKTKSLDICRNILGEGLLYEIIKRTL